MDECGQVQVWWPPEPIDLAQPDPAADGKQEGNVSKPIPETAGVSSETLAILKSLGGSKAAQKQAAEASADVSVNCPPAINAHLCLLCVMFPKIDAWTSQSCNYFFTAVPACA